MNGNIGRFGLHIKMVPKSMPDCEEITIDESRPEQRLSVRGMVEFLLRSGDLDRYRRGGDALEAMQAGARIHRKLQKEESALYHAEVPLAARTEMKGYTLLVEGRADGLIYDDALLTEWDERGDSPSAPPSVTVDEIKTTDTDPQTLSGPDPVHAAQAKCYAVIFAREHHLPAVSVRMTYVSRRTMAKRHFILEQSAEELSEFWQELLARWAPFGDFRLRWSQTRDTSLDSLAFPFSYREGQQTLVRDVRLSIHRKKTLFVQAPTGSGKTLAMLFPALRSMGEGELRRIFYLTARNVTRRSVWEALHLFSEGGLRIKAVELLARERLCPQEEMRCDPVGCPLAKGHEDRILKALYESLTEEDLLTRDLLQARARAHAVCPCELARELAEWCDLVLCDYNYVFDPTARLKRLSDGNAGEDTLLLVDEAHNLAERARQMFSASLCRGDFQSLRKLCAAARPSAARRVSKLARMLSGWEKTFSKADSLTAKIEEQSRAAQGLPEGFDLFLHELERLDADLFAWFEESDEEPEKAAREIFFRIRFFQAVWSCLDETYAVFCEGGQDGFAVSLFCMDPSGRLQEVLDTCRSTVFFSATLLPVNYYKSTLCRDPEPYAVYAQSCFPHDCRRVLCAEDVSSRYSRRGKDMYRRFARHLFEFTAARRGNYLFFAPSYAFMLSVLEAFREILPPAVELFVQTPEMSEEERDSFLDFFAEDVSGFTHIGFCVMGGVFSEGIDLPGERLIGVAVAGAGLPQVSVTGRLIQDYYDGQGLDGFSYAYRYPGMNKVLQAAGRLIRTPEDRGLILLLDSRFLDEAYRRLFPREWTDIRRVREDSVRSAAKEYWNGLPDR